MFEDFFSFFSQPSLNKTVTLSLILGHRSCFPDFQSPSLDYSFFKHGAQTSTQLSYLGITNIKLSMAHSTLTHVFFHFCHSNLDDCCSAVAVYDPYILFCTAATLQRVSSPVFIQLIFLTLNCSLSFLYHFRYVSRSASS